MKENAETAKRDFHGKDKETQSNGNSELHSDIQKNVMGAVKLFRDTTDFDQSLSQANRRDTDKEG